jgi:hypothetical protein
VSDDGRRQFKKDFVLVQKVLWEDWDPIGCGVPKDEYDAYVPGVIGKLRHGADESALVAHLDEVGREWMGAELSDDHLRRVAARLLELQLD